MEKHQPYGGMKPKNQRDLTHRLEIESTLAINEMFPVARLNSLTAQ
jgi:hypothetical protein